MLGNEEPLMESPGKEAHKLRLENLLSTFWRKCKNPVCCLRVLLPTWLYIHAASPAWSAASWSRCSASVVERHSEEHNMLLLTAPLKPACDACDSSSKSAAKFELNR